MYFFNFTINKLMGYYQQLRDKLYIFKMVYLRIKNNH